MVLPGMAQNVINRTTGANTVNDPRLMSTLNMVAPKYADTSAANAADKIGVDSSAAFIFTYDINAFWYRAYNPKRWIRLGGISRINDSTLVSGLDTVVVKGMAESLDSLTVGKLRVDSILLLPLADSLRVLAGRGDIRFDTTTNSILYWDGAQWTYVASLANSLIPNRPNMRLAAGVIRPTIVGTSITWEFLADDVGHDSILFTGVSPNGSWLDLEYPTANKVITLLAVPDETLASKGIFIGASVGTSVATLRCYQQRGTVGGYLVGNNTTYVNGAGLTGFSVINYNSSNGLLQLWYTGQNYENPGLVANYVGDNQYRLEKVTSGLSLGYFGYRVCDMFGNAVTDAPTSADKIDVRTNQPNYQFVNMNIVDGTGYQASIFTELSNIWIIALLEY